MCKMYGQTALLFKQETLIAKFNHYPHLIASPNCQTYAQAGGAALQRNVKVAIN